MQITIKSGIRTQTVKDVASVFDVTPAWVRAATKYLGNVGEMAKGGPKFNSDDMDRFAELKAAGWKN